MTPTRSHPTLAAFIALAITLGAAAREDERKPSAEEWAEACEWFEHLTVPDVAGRPFVEVVKQRFPTTGGRLHEEKRRGFLLAEDAASWTLAPDSPDRGEMLWPLRVPKPTQPPVAGASPDRRDGDVDALAKSIRAEVERPRGDDEPVYSRGRRGGGHAAIFLLARLCARAGHADAAAVLDRALLEMPLTIEHDPERRSIPTLRAVIEQQTGWGLWHRTLTAFADEAVPRAELFARCEQLAREFPGLREIAAVRTHADTLRRMVAEDAQPARDPAALPPSEQAREWIFRLRDQTERKHGGWASGAKTAVLEPQPQAAKDPRPAQQLLQLGHAAVPALIEGLTDARLTRAIQTYNMQPSLPKVLTVADCVEEILERIAGRSFWWERMQAKSGADSTPADIQPAVRKWWREMQERGELAVMAETIRQGGQSSMEQTARLAPLDPAATIAALPDGIRRAESGWIAETRIGHIARMAAESAVPFLAEQMGDGRWQQGRVAAARALNRRGDARAVPAMIEEWRRWQPATGPWVGGENPSPEVIASFLANAGRAEAIDALAERFPSLPPTARGQVLVCFRLLPWTDAAHVPPPWSREGHPELRAARRAAEGFLLRALDDREVDPAMTYGAGDKPSWKARVCDHAASALLSLRGEDRLGPGEASLARRDALIVDLKKALRFQ